MKSVKFSDLLTILGLKLSISLDCLLHPRPPLLLQGSSSREVAIHSSVLVCSMPLCWSHGYLLLLVSAGKPLLLSELQCAHCYWRCIAHPWPQSLLAPSYSQCLIQTKENICFPHPTEVRENSHVGTARPICPQCCRQPFLFWWVVVTQGCFYGNSHFPQQKWTPRVKFFSFTLGSPLLKESSVPSFLAPAQDWAIRMKAEPHSCPRQGPALLLDLSPLSSLPLQTQGHLSIFDWQIRKKESHIPYLSQMFPVI